MRKQTKAAPASNGALQQLASRLIDLGEKKTETPIQIVHSEGHATAVFKFTEDQAEILRILETATGMAFNEWALLAVHWARHGVSELADPSSGHLTDLVEPDLEFHFPSKEVERRARAFIEAFKCETRARWAKEHPPVTTEIPANGPKVLMVRMGSSDTFMRWELTAECKKLVKPVAKALGLSVEEVLEHFYHLPGQDERPWGARDGFDVTPCEDKATWARVQRAAECDGVSVEEYCWNAVKSWVSEASESEFIVDPKTGKILAYTAEIEKFREYISPKKATPGVSFTLTPEQLKTLAAIAEASGVSQAAVMRVAVGSMLDSAMDDSDLFTTLGEQAKELEPMAAA
jgi:hypothetical protein